MIKSRGFIPESHYIKTSDGYILTVNRILNPFVKNRKSLIEYDLPAIISYIKKETSKGIPKVFPKIWFR